MLHHAHTSSSAFGQGLIPCYQVNPIEAVPTILPGLHEQLLIASDSRFELVLGCFSSPAILSVRTPEDDIASC